MKNKAGRIDWALAAFPALTMPTAGKKTAKGWTIETLIPMSALRQGDLKPGRVIGFELQIDTGTNVFYHWTNDDANVRSSETPRSWGEAILGGERDKKVTAELPSL